MFLHHATVDLDDSDLSWATGLLPPVDKLTGLQAKFLAPATGGEEAALIDVSGKYAAFLGLTVPFSTTWKLSATGPLLQAELGAINVAGVPVGPFRGVLMSALRNALDGLPGVKVYEEGAEIDAPVLIKKMVQGAPNVCLAFDRISCTAAGKATLVLREKA